MYIFVILFSVLFFFACLNIISRFNSRIYCFILGCGLTCVAFLRAPSVGFDYVQYEMFISYISTLPSIYSALKSSLEPSFSFITYFFVNNLNLSSLYVFFIYAFLGVMIKVFAFNKYSCLPVVSLLLYFQSSYFSGEYAQIRQSVALSFFIFTCYSVAYNENKKAFFYNLLAILFHYSAVIGIVLIPIKIFIFKFERNKVVISLFLMLLVSFVFSFFGFKLSGMLSLIIPFDFVTTRIVSYSDSNYSIALGFGISDILRFIVCFLIFVFLYKDSSEEKYRIYVFYIVGCILYFLLKNDGILGSRTTNYFKILDCFIISDFIYKYTRVKGEAKYFFIAMSLSFLLVYSSLSFYKNVFTINEFSKYIIRN